MAAVEFALLLPVMITLFFGMCETSLALLCRADVSIMVSTTADLIAQESTVQSSDLTNVYDAASTILYPNPTSSSGTRPTIRITSIDYDTVTNSTTEGKIGWTCTQSGSGSLSPATRSVGQTVNLPQAIMASNGSVIMAEVAYSYASPTSKIITGPINMTNIWYTKPRRVLQIPLPTGGCP